MVSTDNENKTVNQKLKHFQHALDKSEEDSYIVKIIKKLGNLDSQITPTSYLELHCPELIGSTALYFAYEKQNLKAFRMLLDHGIDYTLKSQYGLTILHVILKSIMKNSSSRSDWIGRLENPFISAILAAHIKYKQTANPCDPHGFSHFHAACMTNNVDAVKLFVDNGVSINDGVSANSSVFPGYTPLHFAVRHFSLQVVEVLLEYGANLDTKDTKGMTPLHVLLKRNFEMANFTNDVQSSFQQERDLSEKITKLIWPIVAKKHTMIIDDSGLSCLHIVCSMMDVMVVELLLRRVNDIDHCIDVNSPSWPGYTALHFAAIFNVNIFKLLVSRGANLKAKNASGATPLDLCLERYKVEDIHDILSLNPNWKNIVFSDGKTKLLDVIAAMRSCDHFETFLRKITEKEILSLSNDSALWPGFTPMHLVVLFSKNMGNLYNEHQEVVDNSYLEMITELSVKNMKMIEAQDIHGYTPLHLCFRLGKMKNVVDLLLTMHEKLESSLDLVDEDNLSLLYIACANKKLSLIEKLLLHDNSNLNVAYKGEDIKKLILKGWTPLHVVVVKKSDTTFFFGRDQSIDIVKTLLKYGANVNAKDAHGMTPVHLLIVPDYYLGYSCSRQEETFAIDNILLSAPDLEECVADDLGLSHLHVACFRGREDVVRELVDKGADVNRTIKRLPDVYNDFSREYDGSRLNKYVDASPMHMTVVCYQKNGIANFLLRQGADVFRQGFHGMPLLYIAVKMCKSSLVNLLKENSPLQLKIKTEIGSAAKLHFACMMNDTNLVKELIDSGTNVNAKISLNSAIWPGYTPLQIFMHYGRFSSKNVKGILKSLLDNGADVNARISSHSAISPGRTALHIFVKNLSFDKKNIKITKDMLKLLLDNGADVNAKVSLDSGIYSEYTPLHILLHRVPLVSESADVMNDVLELLLTSEADINAQISLNSAMSPGYTPLHIVMRRITSLSTPYVNDLLKLLLDRHADVAIANVKQRTPLHMAYKHFIAQQYYTGVQKQTLQLLTMMLKAIKDFKVNPTSIEGITHFHIACNVADVATVEKFLKYGNIDINQPLDSFFHDPKSFKSFPGAGCTPLHLAVIPKKDNCHYGDEFVEFTSQLETVDLLLKYGADVEAKNAWGETPFHIAVSFELRERLTRGGANVNAKNAKGYTILESLVMNRPKSSDTIKDLLRCGCRYNTFDSETKIGYIGLTARSLPIAEMQKLISMTITNFPSAIEVDDSRRTAIHNLVSTYQTNVSASEYTLMIEQLTRAGCDLDDQDNFGRTALHIAVEFGNLRAISGLLLAGTDINITDVSGKTALAQLKQLESCTRCNQPSDAEDEQCQHYKMYKILMFQVKKLQLCGLDVCRLNENVLANAFPNFNYVNADQFVSELEEMKNAKIGSYTFTLRNLMSEIDAVAYYPTMSQEKKNAIDEIFLQSESYRLHEKYSEAAGLLKLQYRKALRRPELIQKAKVSLNFFAGIQLPEICSHIILLFLTNSELKCMITASEDNE